jgi:hypothetical protein
MAASQIASASFVGLRGRTAATVLLTVVRLALHERLDASGRDEADLVAQLPGLAAPEVRAAAGFPCHQARRQVAEERQHLIPSRLLAQNTGTRCVSAMHLKHSSPGRARA